jgi:hypothetical protein
MSAWCMLTIDILILILQRVGMLCVILSVVILDVSRLSVMLSGITLSLNNKISFMNLRMVMLISIRLGVVIVSVMAPYSREWSPCQELPFSKLELLS